MTDSSGSTAIQALEPSPVWHFFAELCAIPRPSKFEHQAQNYIRETARRHGFELREDGAGNLVVAVPGTPGFEQAPITVLQGHLDMVCEKNTGTAHDFRTDPIRPVLDTDPASGQQIVRADGTTLGADNGIGVALALAAATSPDVAHGPLEILCTADEEQGMTSAKALDGSLLKGRRMLNLDSEEDDAIYIGCAGGCDSTLTWELKAAAVPVTADTCRISVGGLLGGHSGCDIHLNRGSAIKLLVQVLRESRARALRLAEFHGGSKRNAIPREASAVVAGGQGLAAALRKAATGVQADAVQHGEPKCTIEITPGTASAVATPVATKRLLTALAALPHGVLAVVPEIAGLIQTSNSTSTVASQTENGVLRVTVGCLSRSSQRMALHVTAAQIAAVGQLAGARAECGNEYPGWAPRADSAILKTCRQIYERLFGHTPKVAAIHAGLECGILGERVGEGLMDMVSIGPHIRGAHSPDERVYVASVQKSWQFLKAILAEPA